MLLDELNLSLVTGLQVEGSANINLDEHRVNPHSSLYA